MAKRSLWLVACLCVGLSGCELLPNRNWEALTGAWSGRLTAGARSSLDPRFEYLSLTREDVSLQLALGYRDPVDRDLVHKHEQTQWYSSVGETFAFVDGRIQRSLGTAVEWRATRELSRPAWAELTRAAAPVMAWSRERDEMPGYRQGIVDRIRSRAAHADDALPREGLAALGDQAATMAWVVDEVESRLSDGRPWTYRQWFALQLREPGGWAVRWSRQCLAPQWCLDLMPLGDARF